LKREAQSPLAPHPLAANFVVPIVPPARKTSAVPPSLRSVVLSVKIVRIAPSKGAKAIVSRSVLRAAKANVPFHHRVSVHHGVVPLPVRVDAELVSVRIAPSKSAKAIVSRSGLPAVKANVHIHPVNARPCAARLLFPANAYLVSVQIAPSGQSRQAENVVHSRQAESAVHSVVKASAAIVLPVFKSPAVVNAATANRRTVRVPASKRAPKMRHLVMPRPVRRRTSAEASASRAPSLRASPAIVHQEKLPSGLGGPLESDHSTVAMQSDFPVSAWRVGVPKASLRHAASRAKNPANKMKANEHSEQTQNE
jgi:hypothetical protein